MRGAARIWARKLLGIEDPTQRIDAFYAMLRTRSYGLKPPADPPSPQWKRLNEILAAASADRTWNMAYEAEEILVWLVDDACLDAMFESRATDAEPFLDAHVIEKRRAQFKNGAVPAPRPAGAPPDPPPPAPAPPAGPPPCARRIALQALNEDLHEYWAEQDERLEYYEQITQATAWTLVISIACFVAAFLLVRGRLKGFANPVFPSLASIRVLSVVVASGFFGAGLSMATGLRTRLDAAKLPDLEKMASWVNLLARTVVGIGAGLALFAMGVAEILKGKALPDFQAATANGIDGPTLAHLVVLCVVAGFSEKLVPSALSKAEPES